MIAGTSNKTKDKKTVATMVFLFLVFIMQGFKVLPPKIWHRGYNTLSRRIFPDKKSALCCGRVPCWFRG
jgi:hypothetical protein